MADTLLSIGCLFSGRIKNENHLAIAPNLAQPSATSLSYTRPVRAAGEASKFRS
jgi:hypothetical protein